MFVTFKSFKWKLYELNLGLDKLVEFSIGETKVTIGLTLFITSAMKYANNVATELNRRDVVGRKVASVCIKLFIILIFLIAGSVSLNSLSDLLGYFVLASNVTNQASKLEIWNYSAFVVFHLSLSAIYEINVV
jgi:hypothetical protein